MKLYLDTTDVCDVSKYMNTGLIDGVTTNFTHLLMTGRKPHDIYNELKMMGVKDIHMEIVGETPFIVKEAMKLQDEFGELCTIKVPCNREGLDACRELKKNLIKTNVTFIFCAAQAILAAKAGATFVSPAVGICDDNSVAGLEVVRSIAELYGRQRVQTEVIASCIKDVYKVTRAFYNGADIVTMPPNIFEKMYHHVLSDAGIKQYYTEWTKFGGPGTNPPLDLGFGGELSSS